MTKIKLFLYVCFILLTLSVTSCGPDETIKQPPIHRFKWDVAVCNSVGCNHYDCDSYIRDGDTYKLFQSDSLTNIIQISPGVPIIFSKQ